MEVLSENMIDQLRMMEEEMQDIASSLHPIDYLDVVGENICDVSGACADLFESMVLILSLSLIIGARDANSCCGAVLLHLFATVDRGRWKFGLHFGRSSKPCPESLHLEAGAMVHAGELAVRRCVCATGADPGELLRVRCRRHHHRPISIMGQIAPEICVVSSEFCTAIEYWPVRTLAKNAHLGVVQVLQGLGQGFMSTIFPVVVIVMTMWTWGFEGSTGPSWQLHEWHWISRRCGNPATRMRLCI